MFSPDWDFSSQEPVRLLIDCPLCGTTYEQGIMSDHPQSECLEIQALNEEADDPCPHCGGDHDFITYADCPELSEGMAEA